MQVFNAPDYSTQLDEDLPAVEDDNPASSNISDIAEHRNYRENQATVIDLGAFRQSRHITPEPALPQEPSAELSSEPSTQVYTDSPAESSTDSSSGQPGMETQEASGDNPLADALAGPVDTALEAALGNSLDNILEQASEQLSHNLAEPADENPDADNAGPADREPDEQSFSFHAEFVDDPETSSASGHWGFTSVNRIPSPPDIQYDDSSLEESIPDTRNSVRSSSGFSQSHGLGSLSSPVELDLTDSRARGYRRLSMLPLALFLMAALAAQYVGYNFADLQHHPRMRTLLTWWCVWGECAAPLRQDISALRSDQLVVRSHPEVAEALQVSFIFRNTATFEQSFPLVELNFTDRENRPVANRVFTPEEYLPEALQQYNTMPVNTPVQAELVLVDPGTEAVNYNLVFRQP